MRRRIRSLGLVTLAIAAVIALGWTSPMATVAQLLAATALIMGGTEHPLSSPPDSPAFVTGFLGNAAGFIEEGQGTAPSTKVAVITPAEFFPSFGTRTFNESVAVGKENLHGCIQGTSCAYNPVGDAPVAGDSLVVYGYSQSAVIASLEKRDLIEYYVNHPEETPPDLSFVLVANPMKPNGGVLQRFRGLTIPILDVTFYGATPTNSDFTTVDISQQYDGWSDFPVYPLNMLAVSNAGMGILLLHGNYNSAQQVLVPQGVMGDTTYYMIAADTLPLLMPMQQLGVPSPLIKVLDAPLRVLVEMGYDRATNPGEPTPARLIRLGNPIADAINLAVAIPTGLDDGIEEVTGTRPFHTEPADMYGVHVGDTLFANLSYSAPTPLTAQNERSLVDEQPIAPPPSGDPADNGAESKTLALPDEVDHDAPVRVHKRVARASDDEPNPPSVRKPLAELVRNPIGFQPDKPRAVRPGIGERPLQKVIKALTGLRPKATDTVEKPAASETGDAKKDAA